MQLLMSAGIYYWHWRSRFQHFGLDCYKSVLLSFFWMLKTPNVFKAYTLAQSEQHSTFYIKADMTFLHSSTSLVCATPTFMCYTENEPFEGAIVPKLQQLFYDYFKVSMKCFQILAIPGRANNFLWLQFQCHKFAKCRKQPQQIFCWSQSLPKYASNPDDFWPFRNVYSTILTKVFM